METEPTELDFSLALHVSRSLKKSLKLKHTQQITQTHSNSNTLSPHSLSLSYSSNPYSHFSNLVPLLNLITLQILTLTFTLQTLTLTLQTSCHCSTSSLFKLSLFKLSLSFKPHATPLLNLITLQTLTLSLQTSCHCSTLI